MQVILGNHSRYFLYSHIIKYLKNNGVSIKVFGGMYGKYSKQITLPEEAYITKCDRKAYYTAFSKYMQLEDFTQTIHCSKNMAGIIYQKL